MPSRPRLPRPAPGQLKWWVIGTVGILAGVALSTWWGLSATLGRPSWQTLTYKVLSDEQVRVDFEVHRTAGTALTCTVEALARDFAPVGTTRVRVPASAGDTATQSVTLRTTSRAVTGQVKSCS